LEVSNEASGRQIAKKKHDAEIEEQRVQLELARASKERQRAVEAEREKGEKEVVEISSAASQQMDSMKKLNSDRVHALGDNANKHYENLAANTAEEIKRNDKMAMDAIQDRKAAGLEKIRSVTDRSEDPFYRMKSLAPLLAEDEKTYTVKVSLPEHEAKNLFVSGEGQYIKLALARRFQDDVKDTESGRATKTNSYQSVSEQIAIPGAYDGKRISRDYKDGVVTITVPKTDFTPKTDKGEAGKKS
jgi:HSP20 family molecular chaperone IbpA